MATRMQQRRATAEQWLLADPILAAGEIGYETDTRSFKIGDGINTYSLLDYFENTASIQGTIDEYVPLTQKGAALGVATLGADGFVPASQLNIDVTGDINAAISTLVDGAPGVLDTLNELAAAIGDDENFITTINTSITDGDAATLASAQSYADTAEADAVATANTYTDAEITSLDASKANVANPEFTIGGATEILNHTGIYNTSLPDPEGPNFYLINLDSYTGTLPSEGDVYYIDHPIMEGIALVDTGSSAPFFPEVYITFNPQVTEGAVGEDNATALANYFATNPTSLVLIGGGAALTISSEEVGYLDGVTSNIQDQLDTKLESSDLTGYATETYVNTAVSNLVDSAPAALDTLNELAAALGDDENFATTITAQISGKADLSHTHVMADITDYVEPAGTTLSDTEPSSPSAGDRWVKTTTWQEYIYFDGYWVEI